MTDDDDLFAIRPAPVATVATPVTRRPSKRRAPADMLKTPSGIVAAFSCICGARDEVIEPAPLTVDCWSADCRRPLAMTRWACPYDPPKVSARSTTAEERARLP